ncbi:DAK2 domain-containing protein [Bacillus sp. V2I10]|uniref:DAK2 domain-containing protein n=1 Tax=Bacillus sp. V2I10 TaxID=3042276 RepID=UPI00277ECB9F|nr:DAK2 domain-containing protein [Bacillus sp. V2I10]MDQ0860165.1 DAK2 domain fusion protein YloV [Bacillus sp. V2I10]
MTITTLDGKRFAEMILQGAGHLSNNAKYVDALNVFPVPDGDTGTNMNLSMTSGAKEVKNNVSEHIGKVGAALSKGLLMGARGNSGVILSQLFRGFSKAIESKSAITSADFANALQAGVNTAYKAVMKPVEGTILTVAKDSAKKAIDTIEADSSISIDQLMEAILTEAKASLERTPDLLPVLKEVGVVDSGGQGLVFVYEGFLAELRGEKVSNIKVAASMTDLVSAEHHKSVASHINTEDIEFGYCTEFMVRFEDDKDAFTEEAFRQDLSEHGDSLLVIADEEIVKVHIHAEYPGQVLTYAQRYGSLINMKIENMRQQHTSLLDNVPSMPAAEPVSKKKEKQKFGIVAVTMGKGIADLFRSIGSHSVIEGGQTMNPSTEDIVQAIKDVHAENVIILPNNSNIVMAAQQAASVVDDHVIVIPSKTVPQGMAAMLAFNPLASAEDNEEIMKDALGSVKTGQITYAVRDTNIDGLDIEKGDFMGIANGKIVTKDTNQLASAKKLLEAMISEDDEILTILQGEDAADDELQELVQFIEEKYTEIDVEAHKGEQPLYSYIFSIE